MNSQGIQIEETSVPPLQTTDTQFWTIIGLISVIAIIIWVFTARIQRRRINKTTEL